MSRPEAVRLRAPLERVSPRARLMWTCTDLLRCVPPMALLLLGDGPWDWFDLPTWSLVGVGVLFAAYGVLVPQWRYLVHRWEVTETAVYTQTGWWARERRIAPMSRVQTVDHREGAISRLFGLATVRVTTASSAGALSIEGLDRDRALVIVDELTRMADSVPGDAT
ncbi:MAG TPA: PH domain-containing protein [Nocardioides sp.]|uniref:PH domain-containing protein n=1 Tax=Nocardioides sp. TaxID=35761 RepID=UPI002F3EF1D1